MIKDTKDFEGSQKPPRLKSDLCIVCAHNPREKSTGCYHWGKKVSNRHQYIYYDITKIN